MIDTEQPDSWWASVDDTPSESPMPLHEVFRLPGLKPGCELRVLHASKAGEKDEPWVDLDLTSALGEEKRKKLARKKRGSKLRPLVQLAIVLLIIGIVIIFVPRADQQKVEQIIDDPVERVIAKMSEVQSTRAQGTEVLPALQVSVATSGRILFISNLSGQVWPSCEVIINEPDGYSYRWSDPVESLKTLHAPLRHFTNSRNQAYDQDSTPLRRVTIIVPGYRRWEDRFR